MKKAFVDVLRVFHANASYPEFQLEEALDVIDFHNNEMLGYYLLGYKAGLINAKENSDYAIQNRIEEFTNKLKEKDA